MTPKEQLWKRYHAAIKAGQREEAKRILKQIHAAPRTARSNINGRTGGCSRCRKRF